MFVLFFELACRRFQIIYTKSKVFNQTFLKHLLFQPLTWPMTIISLCWTVISTNWIFGGLIWPLIPRQEMRQKRFLSFYLMFDQGRYRILHTFQVMLDIIVALIIKHKMLLWYQLYVCCDSLSSMHVQCTCHCPWLPLFSLLP